MSLQGCASSPQVVLKTVTVEVPTPVVKPLPHELTDPCVVAHQYPAEDITVADIVDRVVALEVVNICWLNKNALIRKAQ
jgi:hypothetical protein